MWLDMSIRKVPKSVNIDEESLYRHWKEVAYRRKANAIHRYFVENVQNWVDDCWDYLLSKDTLERLVDLCKKVLSSKDYSLAYELLPTRDWFFFGSTNVDELYAERLQYTVNTLKTIIKEFDEKFNYYYSSSW